MRKAAPFILVLILALIAIALKYYSNRSDDANNPNAKAQLKHKKHAEINRNHGFDRRISYIEYTLHAKCRMACRHITQKEVQDIMQLGKINYRKTEVNDKPCPTYALEGITEDRQHVRIVFAQCDEISKVVTTIDLGTKWQCDCPGNDE